MIEAGDRQTVCVAQLGARRHYVVPRIFAEAGVLERLYTDAYAGNKPGLARLLEAASLGRRYPSVERFLNRRAALDPGKVVSYDLLGLQYFLQRHLPLGGSSRSDRYIAVGRMFGRKVSASGFGRASTAYAFNGAALEIFEAAGRHGLRKILDQTIAPRAFYAQLMREEVERWPGWENAGIELDAADDRLAERDAAEWELADRILCGSDFVAKAVEAVGGPGRKCEVVRPVVLNGAPVASSRAAGRADGKISLLFVGEVGLRKGAPYLLEALERLRSFPVHTTFVGAIRLDPAMLARYDDVATFVGAVPRSRVMEYYAQADAFILPSLCEGAAMAAAEAKSCGLPLICTPNTGADFADGDDGLLIAPRSVDAIVEAIEKLPDLLARRRDGAGAPQGDGGGDKYRDALIRAVFQP